MCYHASKHSYEGAKLVAKKVIVKESLWIIDYVNCMRMTLYTHSTVAHAHLLNPVQARDLINQFAKKLVSSLTISSTTCVKLRSKEQNLLYTYMTMTATICSLESSCLAICSPLHVRVHCHLLFVQSVQEATSFTCG